jgi:hypothetical protein
MIGWWVWDFHSVVLGELHQGRVGVGVIGMVLDFRNLLVQGIMPSFSDTRHGVLRRATHCATCEGQFAIRQGKCLDKYGSSDTVF